MSKKMSNQTRFKLEQELIVHYVESIKLRDVLDAIADLQAEYLSGLDDDELQITYREAFGDE